jgi:hypothetical protein
MFDIWWKEIYCRNYNYQTERDRCVAKIAYEAALNKKLDIPIKLQMKLEGRLR